jgi:transcription elongation GreA/GreB family factor
MTNQRKSSLNIKQHLHQLCIEFVEIRWQTINHIIAEIQQSLTSETKSSAGDKHETGRAMLQLEREKAGEQMAEIEKLKVILSKVDVTFSSKTVGLGSVVYTTQTNYFIAISAGEIAFNNENFYAISPLTPIGLKLAGKIAGDTVVFREQQFKVLDVI